MVNCKSSNRKWAILLLAIIALAACRPHGILTSRKMRSVLYDLHRAEAILQVEGLNYGHDEEVAKYYQVVLDKHHVTKAEFDSSLVWYTDHPQLFNKIYPKIMERVKEENKQWQVQEQTPKVVRRNLPPLEEIEHTMRHGWPTELWHQEPDTPPLLGPIKAE